MTTIRVATRNDLATINALGKRMVEEAPMLNGQEFKPLDDLTVHIINQGGAFLAYRGGDTDALIDVLDEPVGFAVGLVYQQWWSSELVVGEMALWVAPEARAGKVGVQLIRALEDYGHARGCTRSVMALGTGVRPERVERLYVRLGYRRSASNWERPLSEAPGPRRAQEPA